MKKSLSSHWRSLKRRLSRWKQDVGARMRTAWKAAGRGEALFFLRRLTLILTLLILKHLLNAGCADDLCSREKTERLTTTVHAMAADS